MARPHSRICKLALAMTTAVPIPALFHPAACSWTKAAAMSIASSAAALIRGLLQSLRPAPLVAHACQPDLLPPAPSLEMVMGPDGYGGRVSTVQHHSVGKVSCVTPILDTVTVITRVQQPSHGHNPKRCAPRTCHPGPRALSWLAQWVSDLGHSLPAATLLAPLAEQPAPCMLQKSHR